MSDVDMLHKKALRPNSIEYILIVIVHPWFTKNSVELKYNGYLLGHHNRDILTNRLTAVIDMSLPVITGYHTGYDR